MLVILLSTGSTLLPVLRTMLLVSVKPTTEAQCLELLFGIWSSKVQALGPKAHVLTGVPRSAVPPRKFENHTSNKRRQLLPRSFEILIQKSS
jgi:hypothetical protein